MALLSVLYLNAQTTPIPDSNFENYLETHASDGSVVSVGDVNSMGDGIADNGLVFTDRISNITSLSIINLGIDDLAGIEDFTSLEILVCSNNTLSSVDVSSNVNLKLLNVSNNRIGGELIVSSNTNLESLFCASNQITTIDLSSNTVLKNLDASENAITSIDLSNINTLVCPEPQTNPLTICQGVGSVNVSRNQLNSLVVNNGYNDLITVFNATNNPDLFCIQIDAGFTPTGWLKDDWTYFSENACVDIFTYVPDDNFEQSLITDGLDDVLDNLVLTENIDTVVNLDVSNASISSLVGIEDFLALETLDCSNNTIEDIDLSNNVLLQELDVSNNNLTVLDISSNPALTILNCANNIINALDISSVTMLTILNCSNNVLANLDLSANVLLEDLDVSFNEIESLNVSANNALTSLLCNNNNLFALNVNNGNNASINTFNATNNTSLFCIEVDDVALANAAAGWQKDASANYNLDCGTYVPDDNFEQELIDAGIDSDGTLNNYVATSDIVGITSLIISGLAIEDLTGIEDFTALQDLDCSNNNLSILDLNANTALQTLDCSNNQIIDLNLSTNTALTALLCNDNALLTLNIENGNNASMATFNATNNPNLYCINVDDTIVGNIPGTWQKDAIADYNGDCYNSRFTAIPDAFFEQALINLGYDDVIDAQVLTSNIEHITNLNVNDKGISDLTGIQDFKSLVELDCSGNYLENLDVSGMIYLERLNCSLNYLLTNDTNATNGILNITGTVSLVELYCSGNNLNDLDMSQNPNLELLDCSDNDILSLDVSNNWLLRTLNCSNNDLTTLDVSANSSLENLNCNSNELNDLTTIGIPNTTLISLSCADNDLSNLIVENYQSLEVLNCSTNELTQLNVVDNVDLHYLSVSNNQISDINLLNNTNLLEFQASQNSLTQLDISTNVVLEQLNCNFNQISQLDFNSNTLLELITCTNNLLSEVNVSNNINLIELNASANNLTSLVLANNLGTLKTLNVSNNQIEGDLDLTTMAISACVYQANQTEFCPENVSINVSNNQLTFINLQNGINDDIINFNASGNPNLDCIQVDDVNNIGINWIKDADTSYNINCNFGETYIPDDNFELALIAMGYDSGPLDDYVLTANIDTLMSLDVSGNAIADLTGIEDFEALEILNCSNNALIEIDLSSNFNLLNIDCSNNQLSSLDVSENIQLTNLNCSTNTIETLDLSANTNLLSLNISSNSFASFTPSEVLSLQEFNCDNNSIVELNFQLNQSLTSISCQDNLLEVLNIRNGQNAILTNLNAQNNPNLTCVETDTGTIPANATWLIDSTAQFVVECFFGQTYVPDDNFEQALIDLGFDSVPLDDYVYTENIEDINFLNVSGREILDLTGIEDFVSLTHLDFSLNSVSSVDLSNNTLLVNLNVSNNELSDLDLTALSNLTSLNASYNFLTQLDLDNNVSVINLNVSNNLLTSLMVDDLVNLEDFNCGSNAITSLNLAENPNLSLVFCQANMLIADQLNLQNGNNESILVFNATNNPDLGCILVDDPVAIITNTDGTYDNWLKDATASYQLICEDADNDGVPNEDDLCPNTEFGASVDLFGCAIIDLPNDNFTILITGESCMNSNDGKITIDAQQLYAYTATLTGENFYQEYNFTNDVDMLNLLAGTYEMCISIEEWPDYYSCYTIVITQPDPLEVFASRAASGTEVSIDMSGSNSYTIEFNGTSFITHNSNITLQLQQGINHLRVSTDLECQGVYEKEILMTNAFIIYPNPFKDAINLYHNNIGEEKVTVSVYSNLGQLMIQKSYKGEGDGFNIDTSNLEAGLYIVKIKSLTQASIHKIIKQ